jgi:prophage tail gpP-like protein
MPRTEIMTVVAGGGTFTGFERIMVRASFSDAARSFQLKIAAENGGAATAWTFKAGTRIQIFSSGSLLCDGYVDRYQPKNRAHEQAHIMVSGRSRSQDFVDSSAVHDTNQFKNKTPVEIAQAIDKFGIGVSTDEQLDKVPIYRVTPGETAFRCLEKLCREQGVFAVGQADGSILVTRGGKKSQAGQLREGFNIAESDADHNWSGRHSDVMVRGQQPYGHGEDALQIEGVARDAELGRYRPVIVFHDGDTSKQRAKKRASTRRDREAGNALKANVTVVGHHDDGGQLWEPGNLVFTESQFLDIKQDMAIESATYSQDRGDGTLTELSLVDPRALGGKAGKGGSAGDAWSSDAGED